MSPWQETLCRSCVRAHGAVRRRAGGPRRAAGSRRLGAHAANVTVVLRKTARFGERSTHPHPSFLSRRAAPKHARGHSVTCVLPAVAVQCRHLSAARNKRRDAEAATHTRRPCHHAACADGRALMPRFCCAGWRHAFVVNYPRVRQHRVLTALQLLLHTGHPSDGHRTQCRAVCPHRASIAKPSCHCQTELLFQTELPTASRLCS